MVERMNRMQEHLSEAGESAKLAVRDRAGEVVQHLRQAGIEASRAVQEGVTQVRDSAAQCYEQGRQRVQDWGGVLQSDIERRPFRSILIAAGIGFLLGIILAKR